MAKKYFDGPLDRTMDWGGDINTGNLPASGSAVQEFIKKQLDSKAGYVGRVDSLAAGFYVLARDEEAFVKYKGTITEENPNGDLNSEGIIGRFEAPFEYKMSINIVSPENGYASSLIGSTGNNIVFRAVSENNKGVPQKEGISVTYKIESQNGAVQSYTLLYSADNASKDITYSLDGKLAPGKNSITIIATGRNTNATAMYRVEYNVIDMYLHDHFNIDTLYKYDLDGSVSIPCSYDFKGVGDTVIYWYIDGNLHEKKIWGTDPLRTDPKIFTFLKKDGNMLPGVHTLQFYMECTDLRTKDKFVTPIYYREFFVESNPATTKEPMIARQFDLDNKGEMSIIQKGQNPTLFGASQFEIAKLKYAVYHKGMSKCKVSSYLKYANNEEMLIGIQDIELVSNSVSKIQELQVSLEEFGEAELIIRPEGGKDVVTEMDVQPSKMDIKTDNENVSLFLSAFGKSNDSADKEIWNYEYDDVVSGEKKVITTDFSKNRYVKISKGEVIPTLPVSKVSVIPSEKVEGVEYLIMNGEYYVWEKEFEWSQTSGWNNGKLLIADGNSITVNMKPFGNENLISLRNQGATYEFEFRTINVSNDDAIICKICGAENDCPGILIKASSAELVIDRSVSKEGYIKAVTTKYKAGETIRISFVITPDIGENEKTRLMKIFVNGVLCGAEGYAPKTSFYNDSKITFRGTKDAEIELASLKFYSKAIEDQSILDNYIYYRDSMKEKREIYNRNDVLLESNKEEFDIIKLKSQLPVMTFYQIDPNETIEQLNQEKKNKKLAKHFDVVYEDINHPELNFVIKNAMVTPQGTSSMAYPIKNFRIYTKKDKERKATLYVGNEIFNNPSSPSLDDLNPAAKVEDRTYSFKKADDNHNGAAPVACWCLKADFAESSSSHNTGTARYWNDVLINAGLKTQAQRKAAKENYEYDVRTCVDGFPIVLFYQRLGKNTPEFVGKYNFNNDKSTEDVFGFTGGPEVPGKGYTYFYIGRERPIIQWDKKKGKWACTWAENVSDSEIENPTKDSPLYVSNTKGDWFMLRGPELLDNPRMECWEFRNSVTDLALFKSMKGCGYSDDNETIGVWKDGSYTETFESRYPDCGDYYHANNLKRFIKWVVSTRYLKIVDDPNDENKGIAVPFSNSELPEPSETGKITIQSLTKKTGNFSFDYPGKNFYKRLDDVPSDKQSDRYTVKEMTDKEIKEMITSDNCKEVSQDPITLDKDPKYTYLKYKEKYYVWTPGNYMTSDVDPTSSKFEHQLNFKYVLYNGSYYIWDNIYKFEDYHIAKKVDDTAENRALKFQVEKWDHLDMNMVAAYYIFLMRFGAVDQTVKNAMLTTEGDGTDDPLSTLPSKWFFINYDNDTILSVKNDGHLVFDPYITRDTKDGATAYAYAGRESVLWNNLEADSEFMDTVSYVDGILASGDEKEGGSEARGLSYANMIKQFETNQTNMWCESIYNKDAYTKYIDSYMNGWLVNNPDGTQTRNYDNFLYDVQGNRNAHRRWWVSRRFNIFDSKFANSYFKKNLIQMRSDDLPAGSTFELTSGEPVYYAWGHDNEIVQMTPDAIKPNDSFVFKTPSFINIGSPIDLYGGPNIKKINVRDSMSNLTFFSLNGCYNAALGTKLKELLIGDHNNYEIKSVTSSNFIMNGLENAKKLEVLDVTNVKKLGELYGLEKISTLRELYAYYTAIKRVKFAEGCKVNVMELPSGLESLEMVHLPDITYEGIKFCNGDYSKLNSLTIDKCPNLMNDYTFVFDWINSMKSEGERNRAKLSLNGIDWKFTNKNYGILFNLENVGLPEVLGVRNIVGRITIEGYLPINDVRRLKNIFGVNCFTEGASVYISAKPAIYTDGDDYVYEGKDIYSCDVTTVGVTSNGRIEISALVYDEESRQSILPESTGGVVKVSISEDNSRINYSIAESDKKYTSITFTSTYYRTPEAEVAWVTHTKRVEVKKRRYPTSVSIDGTTSINDKKYYTYSSITTPLFDKDSKDKGYYDIKWEIIDGNEGWREKIQLVDSNKENCRLKSIGYDGSIKLQVSIIKESDNTLLCKSTKDIDFLDPDTLITKISNPEIYKILKDNGLIVENSEGFGKLTISQAQNIKKEELIGDNGLSIFYNHYEIKSFNEFGYFMGVNEKLDDHYFSGCYSMTSIRLPNLNSIGNSAFYGCTNLKSIKSLIPSEGGGSKMEDYDIISVESIGNEAFGECKYLENLTLDARLTYIGKEAFKNCESLKEFFIYNGLTTIEVSTTSNIFINCKNIKFNGGNNTFIVNNGNLYKEYDGKTYLIHMGAGNTMDSLYKDRTIYAYAYSIENRNEENLTIPNNVVFDGENLFYGSYGNSINFIKNIEDYSIILDSEPICKYLLSYTNYHEYNFNAGETLIPYACFNGSLIKNIELPNTITKASDYCFNLCRNLETITLSDNLEYLGFMSFYGCNNLSSITCNRIEAPKIVWPLFSDSQPDNFYVKGDALNNYKKECGELINIFTISTLPTKGYVKIIKDNSVYSEDNVTVGGIKAILDSKNGIYSYSSDGLNKNTDILINGVKYGNVYNKNYTLYINENNNLLANYTTNETAIDFSKGIYDTNKVKISDLNGNPSFYYDERINALRTVKMKSDDIAQVTISLPQMANKKIWIKYGQTSEPYDYCTIYEGEYNGNNKVIKELNNKENKGYGLITDIISESGIFTFRFVNNIFTIEDLGIFWIEEIGYSDFNEPIFGSLENNKKITLSVNADNAQKEHIKDSLIFIEDEEHNMFKRRWKGEPLSIYLPKNSKYRIYTEDFRYGTKSYFKDEIIVDTNLPEENYSILFKTLTNENGLILGEDGKFYKEEQWTEKIKTVGIMISTPTQDLLISKENSSEKYKWGPIGNDEENKHLNYVTKEKIDSDFNGYDNTIKIYDMYGSDATMIYFALIYDYLKGLYKNYIGSYGEWKTILANKERINELMNKIGGNALLDDNYWTSTIFDKNNGLATPISTSSENTFDRSTLFRIRVLGMSKLNPKR